MAPRKKRIREMSRKEIHRLTDDEVMEKVFDKRTARKLREVTDEAIKKGKK